MALIKCKECYKQISDTLTRCHYCGADQRSWIRQHPIYTIIIVLLCLGILNNLTKTDVEKDAEKQEKQNNESKLITLSEFNRVQTGMSYSEVKEIIGSDGTLQSENQSGNYRFSLFKWDGRGISGASMMFEDGVLYQKSQFGLK